MEVRPMLESDFDAVEGLRVATWKASYVGLLPEQLLRQLEPDVERRAYGYKATQDTGGVALVAVDEAGVVGWLESGDSREEPDAYELYALYVDAARQGRGVGRQLVDAMRDAVAPQPGRLELVWTLRDQSQAVAFYERSGYELDGASLDRPMTLNEIDYVLPLVRLSRVQVLPSLE